MDARSKLIAGGVIAGGAMLLAAGLVVGAGVAKADAGDMDAYTYAVEIGGSSSVSSARALALEVCARRAEGYSESGLIVYLELPPKPVTAHEATMVVVEAEWHFCPHYR
jgi:hypothetical protein